MSALLGIINYCLYTRRKRTDSTAATTVQGRGAGTKVGRERVGVRGNNEGKKSSERWVPILTRSVERAEGRSGRSACVCVRTIRKANMRQMQSW
jgi:hypothetical protein